MDVRSRSILASLEESSSDREAMDFSRREISDWRDESARSLLRCEREEAAWVE